MHEKTTEQNSFAKDLMRAIWDQPLFGVIALVVLFLIPAAFAHAWWCERKEREERLYEDEDSQRERADS